MKHIVGSLGVLVALAALTGCSSQPKMQKLNAANDVFAAMHEELAHTIVRGDAIDLMDDELAHTIGTTMLTSATLVSSPAILASPMPLPESRMSIAETPEDERPLQTWGVPAEQVESDADSDLADIPDSRE